jgi:mono/diheme cytochrome c family protein
VAAAAPASASAPPAYAAVAFPAAAVARGKALYEQTACAACHEAEHPPQGVVPRRLAGLSKKYDAASLAAYLKTPNPPMPAFPFSDQERSDLAAFLLTLHP